MSNSQQRNTKYRQKAMARYDNGDNQKLVRRKRKKHNFKKDLSTEHISKKSKGDTIMTHKKPRKSKIFTLLCSLTICLALMLGIVFASLTFMSMPNKKERLFKTKVGQASTGI